MITCRVYREGVLEEQAFDIPKVATGLRDDGARVWLDVLDPTDADLDMLERQFSLHPLAVEDARHRGQRAKVDLYEGYYFIVLHALSLSDGDKLIDSEMHLFARKGFLITLRWTPAFDLRPVLDRWDRHPELTLQGGAFLLYALLDEVVDGYFDLIEDLEDVSDQIEDEVFADTAVPDVQERIFKLKRRVVKFRQTVVPLRQVLALVEEQPGFVTDELRPYYRDVADHVIRVVEFLDGVRDLLSSALDAQLSQVSNRLNQIMKKLTSWAGIILIPTLIAGIYGMNFRYIPELSWHYGYFIALGAMGLSSVVLYRVFKKQGWL